VLATLRKIDTPVAESRWVGVAELVRRAQAGDREAFGALVEQFERTVHAICARRLGNRSEALELKQEVFLHILRRLDQLREPERFAGWLRQVADRMAINHATRRTALTSVEEFVLEGASGTHDNPLDALILRERADQVREALALLKPLDREVLEAFYIHGQSLVEIATRLDAPIGTIKRRLHTARKRVKAALQARVDDVDEGTDGLTEDPDDDLAAAGAGESDSS